MRLHLLLVCCLIFLGKHTAFSQQQPAFSDHAYWINPGYAEETSRRPCPVFAKDFTAARKVKAATLRISAHGLYEAWLNDKRVGDAWLTPGWTSYQARIQYQDYDVTSLLRKGQNKIRVNIGEGWYRGAFGNRQTPNLWGKDAGLICQLHITYMDGREEEIFTDSTWKTAPGPIRYANIYNGETYDARVQPDHWTPAVTGGYAKEILVPSVAPPVKEHEIVKVQKVFTTPKGEQVIDFGQNLVGWVRFSVKGKAGDTITLAHAEILDREGNFYTENLRTAESTDRYILNGKGVETFAPHFTWHGFRYVKVQGCTVKPEDFTAVVLYSDMAPSGTFSCSNPLVNRLQENITWSLRGNFLDVPTDCPQRSERLGWTADAQVFFRTAAFNYNVKTFFEKWMADIAIEQGADGSMPWVVPDVYGIAKARPPRLVAGWGDAVTVLPWQHFEVYNDTAVLQSHYDGMKRWVDFVSANAPGFLWKSRGFGDWLAPGDSTSLPYIDQCWWAYSTQLVINAAKVLHKTEDIAYYQDQLEHIKAAFLENYITADGKAKVTPTQTAYVLALQFHLLPDSLQANAAAELAALVKANNNHLATGFLGTPFLLFALSDHGYSDLAFTLLMQETCPSWLYPVKQGATTIWEKWDAQMPDGTLQQVSFNHYAYGAVGAWLYSYVAGIDMAAPGYRQLVIHPHVGGGLTWAKASYKTAGGQVVSNWELKGKQLKMHVEIPGGSSALVYVPGKAPQQMGSGVYDLEGAID